MSTKPKLSKRLQCLVDMMPPLDVVADIGCDHGYVPISLVLSSKAKIAYGIDNKVEPLKVAKKNVHLFGCEENVILLNNPLKQPIKLLDGCIIAGVGKESAVSIFHEFSPYFHEKTLLSIQVNAQIIEMRQFMKQQGYRLINEKVVFDKMHYVILHYQKGIEQADGVELWIGPHLLQQVSEHKDYLIELKKTAEHFRSIAQDVSKQTVYAMIDDYLQGIL
ncbi:MAG: SAM-dependent methyltransferase [Erysipelothrix sp.]|nr:SAM-dependent methyltransferase [Erysipelothrix sp.]